METAAEIVRNLSQRLLNFLDRMEGISGDETPQLRSASVSDHDMEQVGPELDTSDEGHRGAAPDTNDIFGGFYTGEYRGETSPNMPGTLWSELPSPPGRFPPGPIPLSPPMRAGGANNIFGHFYTGEHHDDSSFNRPGSSRHMPGMLWPERPGPPTDFWHRPIPAPPMQAGEHHNDSSFTENLFNGAGPRLVMQAGGENNNSGHFYASEHHHDSSFTENLFNDAGPRFVMQARANFLDQLPDISLDAIPNVTGCNICMEPFGSTEDPESPVQLPCGHVMGRKCISRWLETSNSCPLCRHVLFEQGRGFPFEQEGSFLFGQENFNRSWDNLEPRLQELIRSMTAQEQRHLLQVLQEPNPPQTEMDLREQAEIPEIPGVSPEEVEAYQLEFNEIALQRAAIETRLAEIEAEDSLLTSQRATELGELEEDNEVLRARLDNFHGRYRDLINFTLFT